MLEVQRLSSEHVAYLLEGIAKEKENSQWMFLNKPVVHTSDKSEQLSFLTAPSSHPLLSPTAGCCCCRGESLEGETLWTDPPPTSLVSLYLLFCPSASPKSPEIRRKTRKQTFGCCQESTFAVNGRCTSFMQPNGLIWYVTTSLTLNYICQCTWRCKGQSLMSLYNLLCLLLQAVRVSQ